MQILRHARHGDLKIRPLHIKTTAYLAPYCELCMVLFVGILLCVLQTVHSFVSLEISLKTNRLL